MKEDTKAVLWVIGAITQLTDWGFLQGEDIMTGKGHEAFLDLQDVDWKPSDEQLESLMNFYDMDDAELLLLKNYRDDPQKLKAFEG